MRVQSHRTLTSLWPSCQGFTPAAKVRIRIENAKLTFLTFDAQERAVARDPDNLSYRLSFRQHLCLISKIDDSITPKTPPIRELYRNFPLYGYRAHSLTASL